MCFINLCSNRGCCMDKSEKVSFQRKVKVKVKIPQLCMTFCDPKDYTVHGILQARILERVAIFFSRGSPQLRDLTQASCIAGRFFTA